MDEKKRLTALEIEMGRSEKGGFTKARLAEWGVPWPPPKGWRKRLMGAEKQPDTFTEGFQLRMTLTPEHAAKLKKAASWSAIEVHLYALIMLAKMIDRGEFLKPEDWWQGRPEDLDVFNQEFTAHLE